MDQYAWTDWVRYAGGRPAEAFSHWIHFIVPRSLEIGSLSGNQAILLGELRLLLPVPRHTLTPARGLPIALHRETKHY